MQPYKGLTPFLEKDEQLFAGRNKEIEQCSEVIVRSSTALFILHGLSGCGKSSFIRAGLIPNLSRLSGAPGAPTRLLLIRPRDSRFGGPLSALASAIVEVAERVEHRSDEVEAIALLGNSQLADKHRLDPLFLFNALATVTLATPRLPVIFIDQIESLVFSQNDESAEVEPFFQLLFLLCTRRIDLRLCLAMRSEYKARFEDRLCGSKPFAVAGYYLGEMSRDKIREAVTIPANDKRFNFSFADGAVDQLLEKLNVPEGITGGSLAAVQIMCNRLYWAAVDRAKSAVALIRWEDVLALGHPNQQILFHLYDSLYAAFKSDENSTVIRSRRFARASRWMEKLTKLVLSYADGTARSTTARWTELIPEDLQDQQAAASILDYLGDPARYILRKEGDKYCLQHDSIALVLRVWQEGRRQPQRHRAAGDRVLSAATYGLDKEPLWTEEYPQPETLQLATINDAIWDHLLLLFAEEQGFTRRLGIELKESFKTDRPGQPDDNVYKKFFESDGPRAAILPVEIIEVPESFQHVAVVNVFRGYALTGKTRDLSPNAEVRAIDLVCAAFGDILLGLLLDQPPPIVIFPETEVTSRDDFYEWLLDKNHKNRYGIASAPTRARWRQTGQFQEFMKEDIYEQLKKSPEMDSKLRRLTVHEVCVVSGVEDAAWKYRLMSVVFYTVQYILSSLLSFTGYLFDYEWNLSRGIPVSREAIQDTVIQSYTYAEFEAYSHTYLYAMSEDYLHDNPSALKQLGDLYGELRLFQSQYDELLLRVVQPHASDQATRSYLDIAARHYAIYNFYDALEILKKVVNAKSPSA